MLASLRRDARGMGNEDIHRLTEGSVFSKLLRFALPVILGNLLHEIYYLADTIIVGQTLGSLKLGAVGATGPMVALIIDFMNGLAAGCSVLLSQCFGNRNEEALRKSVAAQIVICGVCTAGLTAVSLSCASLMLRACNTTPSAFPYALQYVTVIYAGLPATVLFFLTATDLRAVGDSKTPLIILIFSSLLNIGLDFVFILGLRWDVFGAAFATVISQLLAGALCAFLIYKKARVLVPSRAHWHALSPMINAELRVGIPMGLQNSVVAISMVILQYYVNGFGDAAVSAYTIGDRMEILLQSPTMSFIAVASTFVGQNVGARRFDRIQKGVLQLTVVAIAYSVIAWVLTTTFMDQIVGMFVAPTETETIALGKECVGWIAPWLWTLGILYVYRGGLQGLRDGVTPMIGSFAEVAVRIAIPALLGTIIGFTSICIAVPASWTASAAILTPIFFIRFRKWRKNPEKYMALLEKQT